VNVFSIAVERTAMEKHSAAFAAEKGKSGKLYRDLISNSDATIVEGLCHFAFRRLSEKQNKKQQLCVLGVSAARRCPGPF
jgi:hypothetical protein